MKTPPTYWKVKASPIVREFMFAQQHWRNMDYDVYSNYIEEEWVEIRFNGGYTKYGHFADLPTLTQAQFKKHFYDPWKAGQGKTVAAKLKPTRQRVEMKYHLEVKKALQTEIDICQQRITQLEADRDLQHKTITELTEQKNHLAEINDTLIARLESLKQYNDQLAKINQSLADKLTTAESTIEKLHRSHLNELNELTKERDLAVYIAWGMGLCAALLAVAKLIGG